MQGGKLSYWSIIYLPKNKQFSQEWLFSFKFIIYFKVIIVKMLATEVKFKTTNTTYKY